MTFERKRNKIILLAVLLVIAAACFSWFLIQKKWLPVIIVIPFIVYVSARIISTTLKSEKTILEFVEAVKYNDYSLTYNARKAAGDMQPLFYGLNTISNSIRELIREKNAEKIYLQKILGMVNIGIIAYRTGDGEITWINESFKELTHIPYAKNINSFEKRNSDFFNLLINIKSGQTEIFNFKIGAGSYKLLVNATIFKTDRRENKLIALQNINETLDETESKAWQKLLNVMTHEIMNSVAPISSLADTLIKNVDTGTQNGSQAEDLLEGLRTIRKRSDALQRFAITYRHLNKITRLDKKEVLVRDIFENLHTLMHPTIDQKNIELDVILKEPDLKISADTNLIEQVLINLLTNAIEAVKDVPHAHIILTAYEKEGKKFIRVTDNGAGISDTIAEQIFVPFFSTRKNGNGIGLSLCKQIMTLHKGSIQVFSEVGKGTAFVIGC